MFCYIVILAFFVTNPAESGSSIERIDCSKAEWACEDSSCIQREAKCDGVAQCPDGSDELHALCRNMDCAPNLFRCTYGACVDGTAPCNGIKECMDGSDELGPQCGSRILQVNGKFKCEKSGEEIPAEDRCDGVKNCADGSDETLATCVGQRCAPYEFQCDYGACVSGDAPCDAYGKHHCVNGSDEAYHLCYNYRPSNVCILPEHPKHGMYRHKDYKLTSAEPGQMLKKADLWVTCNKPYSIDGEIRMTAVDCFEGLWDPKMPECKRFCRVPYWDLSVEYTCIVKDGETERERRCERYEPSGTQVNPKCKPGYYQPDPRIMTCNNNGRWNEVVTCVKGKVCGISNNGVPAITDGKTPIRGEVPWQAAIYDKTKGNEQICGGSLVTSQLVISAAHCFWNDLEKLRSHTNFAVALGKLERRWNITDGQWFEIESIEVPDTFKGAIANFQSDIALVFLDRAAEYNNFVKPVCLDLDNIDSDVRQLASGKWGKVAGWGLTSADGTHSEVLKVNEIPIVEAGTCMKNSPLSFQSSITTDKICAGNKTGNALCQGDSGGGLVVRDNENAPYYLRGVMSTRQPGNHKCNTEGYSAFTKVFHHAIFIKNNNKKRNRSLLTSAKALD